MLSQNKTRNDHYLKLIESSKQNILIAQHIIATGYKLMRKARLHHHFFGNSLLKTAQYLTFYALQLPHEYDNEKYLNYKISEQDAMQIIALFEKRIANRMPIEYITHESCYLGNQFYVNENVLVPRSVMSYRFNDFLNQVEWKNFRVLDLCTGSGCIGISLALLHPHIKVDLLDVSEKALAVAAINIEKHQVTNRVKCIQSNLFENINEKYDLIISNPPYVSRSEYNASAAEFKNEPKIALESGKDGLDIVNQILLQAKRYLNPNGLLIVEVGYPAAARIKKQYRNIPFKWLKYKRPEQQTWLGKWIDKLFGMHCVLMCDASALL